MVIDTGHVISSLKENVLTLTLNRPRKRNALSEGMYRRLRAELMAADDAPEIRVILITGAPEVFSSGADLKELMGREDKDPATLPSIAFLKAIGRVKKPLVAAVEGMAIGIGATMLLHCDFVFASARTLFRFPFVNLGLCVEGGASLLLPGIAGYHRAAGLLLTGDDFYGDTAHGIGLVHRLCEEGEVAERARALAERLARKSPEALVATKALLKRGAHGEVTETILAEAERFRERLFSPDAREALTAFFEGRAPDFSAVGAAAAGT